MLSQLLSASSCVWIASPAERGKHASGGWWSHATCGLRFSEYIVLVGHLSPSLTFGIKEMSLLSECSHLFKSHFIPSHHSQALLSSTVQNAVFSNLWFNGKARISQLSLNFNF